MATSAPVHPPAHPTVPANPGKIFLSSRDGIITVATLVAIVVHLVLWLGIGLEGWARDWPLVLIVVAGGAPLLVDVVRNAVRTRGGADTLAAISIATSVALGEWLVAAIIVLMLSGGEALEEAATKRATGTLDALAKRAPAIAHRADGQDVAVADVMVGDELVVLPHELCPVDGEVTAGHGAMDESYLTGEPYVVSKSKGAQVISGAVNGLSLIHI